MIPLCKIATDASAYVAGWLQRQPSLKEESITDWMLDYFVQHSSEVRYYQFTRHEEARISGADWDWWFLLRKGCFKIRSQAKKIQRNHDHYRDLARSNQTGFQIDLLLESSAKHNFYPIYTLYGFGEGYGRCGRIEQPSALFISSAQETYDLVFRAPRKRIESSDLLGLSIPLPCLFCCPRVSEFPSGGPLCLFDHYFQIPPRSALDGDDREPDRERGYEREVPSIIASLYEMKEVNSNNQGFIDEYRAMFPGSSGVTITRIREGE